MVHADKKVGQCPSTSVTSFGEFLSSYYYFKKKEKKKRRKTYKIMVNSEVMKNGDANQNSRSQHVSMSCYLINLLS